MVPDVESLSKIYSTRIGVPPLQAFMPMMLLPSRAMTPQLHETWAEALQGTWRTWIYNTESEAELENDILPNVLLIKQNLLHALTYVHV